MNRWCLIVGGTLALGSLGVWQDRRKKKKYDNRIWMLLVAIGNEIILLPDIVDFITTGKFTVGCMAVLASTCLWYKMYRHNKAWSVESKGKEIMESVSPEEPEYAEDAMEEYEDDVEADMEGNMEFCEEPSKEECIETNMGKMPIGDYREIFAMQHGFDSYKELCEYCEKEENKEER